MFTLGIPLKQYRRATQVLGHEAANPIEYEDRKQDDGFYVFSFPNVDEYDFKDIVVLLKRNGVTTIGADDQLSETKIMKLTNLLKEESPEENNFIDEIKMVLERNRQMFDNPIFKEISDIIRNYEMGGDEDRMMNMPNITEEKIRKFIQNEIKKLN